MAKILVADDERALLDLMERALGKRGHEVETYMDGESAVEAIESDDFDLVMTDLRMPGRSGIEVLAAAKKKRATLPVIIVSGALESEDRARAEALGVYMVLHKPVDLAYLMTIVEAAIEKSAVLGKLPAAPVVRILERDASMKNMIAYCLRRQGFTTGDAAAAAVIIVGDPHDVERTRKEAPRAVLIALHEAGETQEAVKALDAGADVALPRPFDPEILFAHVRAGVRRTQGSPPATPGSKSRIAAVKN
jgi:DNA-binding response OmpR family regulator